MKKLFVCIMFLLGLGSVTAQSFVRYSPSLNNNVKKGDASLKILAVMVEFQEDKYDATIGNGKFGSIYTQDYGDTIIDPLPHDAAYFSDHLEFAKNYYQKVSRGKVNVDYTVLPEVLTVSKYMRDYVPEYNTTDFSPLGNLASEVWEMADKKFTNVNFSNYNLFIIFHAGVSAGIDLGSFTIDRNIPSIYLSESALKNIYGADFKGIPVNQNISFVTNSIIMAETESREFSDIQNKVYLNQFSINGELVGNIASYLGLPDLFNTETGRSAIGKFGLMDSQGMNANYGLFPPEPSPWAKIFLGWETPVTITLKDSRVNIAARITAAINDTTLIKIPINSNEYFLIENRQQDALKNKCIISTKLHGNLTTQIVQHDTSGYFYIIPDSLKGGVVVDVDEFDAAVPGNGIVIWHIDDNIINQNFASNKINAGDIKGIYVEEADGITDIGQLFYTLFGTVIGEGGYEDLWYKGNAAKLFKNRFTNDSKPNSKSNTGANSLITLNNFSAISNKMGFNITSGSENLKLISKTNLGIGNQKRKISVVNFSSAPKIIVTESSNLIIMNMDGSVEKLLNNYSDIQPAAFSYLSNDYLIGAKNNFINIYSNKSGSEELKTVECQGEVTSISIDKYLTVPKIYANILFQQPTTIAIPLDEILSLDKLDTKSFQLYQDEWPVVNLSAGKSFYSVLNMKYLIQSSNTSNKIDLPGNPLKLINVEKSGGGFYSVVLYGNNRFGIYDNGNITVDFEVQGTDNITSFSVADILNNGKNYIVYNSGSGLYAYDFNGALAENFPYELNGGEKFTGTPIIADINNDDIADLLAFSDNGNVYAIEASNTKIISPFPISFGNKLAANPVLIVQAFSNSGTAPLYQPYLAVVADNNDLYIWKLNNAMGKSYWLGENGDSYNSNFATAPQASLTETEFFPLAKTYNWPNPVYGNETNIRYYVSENSDVNIKIFDLAGDFVAELNDRATGGFDNEIKWNVSNIQSGVYFARVNVKSASGKSAEKIIKIAVIK